MILQRTLVAVLLLAAARPAGAVEGARWLLAPAGVRSAALANAVTVLEADGEALWSNPAGLAGLDGVEAAFTHLNYAEAWDSDTLTLAAPLHWRHHFGLLYHHSGAQDTQRDAFGTESGQFEVGQSALEGAYAYKSGHWSLGAGIKSLSEGIQGRQASAMAYDLGAQLRLADQRLRVGLAAQNLGSAPDLGGGPAVDPPTVLRGGAAMRFNDDVSRFEILADYRWRPAVNRGGVSVALDYSEHYMEGRLGLRAGYDFSQAEQGSGAGLALGAGFGYGPVGLDYAWSPRGELGVQHRIALKLVWDLRARARRAELAQVVGEVAALPDVQAPAPAPRVRARGESQAGSRLDELLGTETQPTPAVTPLPQVAEVQPKPKGILGFFARMFGAAPKEEAKPAAGEEQPGLLGRFFNFLGFGGEGAPGAAPVADTPQKAREDSFDAPAPTATPMPMQRLKGDGIALPQATPTPVPVKEKAKTWMKF